MLLTFDLSGDLQTFSRSAEHHSDLEDIPEVDEEDNHRSGGVGKAGLARLAGSRIDSDDPSSLSEITSEPSFDGMCLGFVRVFV